MPDQASTEVLAKITLAELRVAHGNVLETRQAFIRFFKRGLSSGLSLEECMHVLFFEPCQAGSLFRRVGYADHEYDRMIHLVRDLPLYQVLPGVCAEPEALPNGGPAKPPADWGAGEGPPSVS